MKHSMTLFDPLSKQSLPVHDKSCLCISATFTANPLLPHLQNLLNRFSPATISLTYNDFLKQLTLKTSDFFCNSQGANILLFRMTDLCQNFHNLSDWKHNIDCLLEKVRSYTQSNKIPLFIFICPETSQAIHTNQSCHWDQIKEYFLANLRQEKLAHVIEPQEIKVLSQTWGVC